MSIRNVSRYKGVVNMKNGNDIQFALDQLKALGGRVHLAAGAYPLHRSIQMDTPSTRLEGDVWAYNLDPNGVFETPFGTKLRLQGRDFPAIRIGDRELPAGMMICDLGIQGDIEGMDTRPLLHKNRMENSAGLYFGGERVDQGEFSKISFCGLAVAVCAEKRAELDACVFERLNFDGCCMGVYFVPRAAYYDRFRQCVVADTPSYGFYADGTHANMHNVELSEMQFIRNCGSNPFGESHAAVYLKNVYQWSFRDNLVDLPGTFWYFAPDAGKNDQHQDTLTPAVGLNISGNENRIMNNVFLHSSRESIVLQGNDNVLMNNMADGDVVIEGRGNQVNGLVFTRPEAKLILKGEEAHHTHVMGVEESRILRL